MGTDRDRIGGLAAKVLASRIWIALTGGAGKPRVCIQGGEKNEGRLSGGEEMAHLDHLRTTPRWRHRCGSVSPCEICWNS